MTAAEQRLALLLGGVVLVGGAFIALTSLKSWKQRVDLRGHSIAARSAEANGLMAKKLFWEQRSEWLGEKLPLFSRRGEADNGFLELLRESASAHDLDLTQTQPMEPVERPGLTSSSIVIEARGNWKAVNEWLHGLQKPDAYISISSLTLTPNEEDTNEVIVNMNAQKWFRLPPS